MNKELIQQDHSDFKENISCCSVNGIKWRDFGSVLWWLMDGCVFFGILLSSPCFWCSLSPILPKSVSFWVGFCFTSLVCLSWWFSSWIYCLLNVLSFSSSWSVLFPVPCSLPAVVELEGFDWKHLVLLLKQVWDHFWVGVKGFLKGSGWSRRL